MSSLLDMVVLSFLFLQDNNIILCYPQFPSRHLAISLSRHLAISLSRYFAISLFRYFAFFHFAEKKYLTVSATSNSLV